VPYVQFPRPSPIWSAIKTLPVSITVLPVVTAIKTGKAQGARRHGKEEQSRRCPDVQTIREDGYSETLASEEWAGMLIKRGTPAPVVARLNAAIERRSTRDRCANRSTKLGVDPGGGEAEPFGHWALRGGAWSKVSRKPTSRSIHDSSDSAYLDRERCDDQEHRPG